MWKGESPLQRPALSFHSPHYAFHKRNRLGSAIRKGDYKLIHYYDDDSVELFNLANDIEETQNLATAHSDKAVELKSDLQKWLNTSRANFPIKVDEASIR
jgi:arylsulfatase A-like enzyme